MRVVLLVVLLTGCGATKKPMEAAVPGCPGAKVVVSKGCYVQVVGGATEVRCPGGTNTYVCKGGAK